MVASDAFAEFLREQLAPLGHVTLRRMFGKSGVFCDGVMLGALTTLSAPGGAYLLLNHLHALAAGRRPSSDRSDQ